MKHLLRVFTFVLIAVFSAEMLLPFFSFGKDPKTMYLFIVLLFLLFNFKKPILKTIALPDDGLLYLFISFVLTLIVINVYSMFFSYFHIEPVTTPNLLILGVVLTSYNLSKLWSGALAALLISLIYNYLDWVSRRKK
ncbi:hypothetical protein GYA27_00565 [candidate division WWE3 bacterium]|uniref:Uncharacterized protein n=1 Tax=candidate division WWE3 bacterium TaxID=2053526 RepID=A0A7X9HGK4_UNCKA|nr:hypothetical protein [candidate division WWE3 bacterium]